jgi:hypothetical protein
VIHRLSPQPPGAPMNVCYRVELSQAERDQLTALLSGGVHAARKLKRAQILLAADAGIGDEDIAAGITVGGSTVCRTKRRFVGGNLKAALSEEPRPGAARKLTGKEECSCPGITGQGVVVRGGPRLRSRQAKRFAFPRGARLAGLTRSPPWTQCHHAVDAPRRPRSRSSSPPVVS